VEFQFIFVRFLNEVAKCSTRVREFAPERDLHAHEICHKLATGRSGPRRTIEDFCGFQRTVFIEDLYQDWKAHGIQAIRETRETRPADYLKIVAMIVSKAEDLSLDSEMRDAAVEQFIEERRQQALAMIAKMDEADDA
jgi:hypothetical protein